MQKRVEGNDQYKRFDSYKYLSIVNPYLRMWRRLTSVKYVKLIHV